MQLVVLLTSGYSMVTNVMNYVTMASTGAGVDFGDN